jgi:hypothetical protein
MAFVSHIQEVIRSNYTKIALGINSQFRKIGHKVRFSLQFAMTL